MLFMEPIMVVIMLGMTMKSLTSRRKINDIINRYGHCIIYQGIEETLKSLAFGAKK